jgi:hypothetical protein
VYSIDRNPSCEAKVSLAVNKFPSLFMEPVTVFTLPTTGPHLWRVNPAHILKLRFFETHFYNIRPSYRFPKLRYPYGFSHKNFICISRMLAQAGLVHLYNRPNNICWRVHIMMLLIMEFHSFFCYTPPPSDPGIPLRTRFSKTCPVPSRKLQRHSNGKVKGRYFPVLN